MDFDPTLVGIVIFGFGLIAAGIVCVLNFVVLGGVFPLGPLLIIEGISVLFVLLPRYVCLHNVHTLKGV